MALSIAFLAALGGCGGEAEHPGVGQWMVDTEPRLVLGDPLDDDQALYDVTAALRVSDGSIVVANDGSKELLAFDSTGLRRWRVGREGQGPGEFGRVADLALLGDTILVWDSRNGRLARLSTDGRILGTVSFQQPPDIPLTRFFMSGVLGDSAVVLYRLSFPIPNPGPAGLVWDSAPNLLYGLQGEILDTMGFGGQEQFRDPAEESHPFLWTRRSARATGGGYFYTGNGEAWRIERYSGDGAVEVITLPLERESVTGPELQAFVDRELGRVPKEWPEGLRAEARRYWEGARAPEVKPAYGAMVVDDLGYLWVGEFRHLREYALPGPRTWQVLDPEGRWVAEAELPDMEVHQIGRDHVLGWRLGPMDVEQVVLYRLRRP